MVETEMLLAGVSIENSIYSKSIPCISSKEDFLSIPKPFHNNSLNESRLLSTDDFAPYKEEEIFRDEEHGFVIKKEYSKLCPDGIEFAYNLDGKYIGDPKNAKFLCIDKGIRPETYDDNKVCTIGFCEKEQAWYGWSHRAFSPPFKIGYTIESEDNLCTGAWGPNEKSLEVGFTAKTLDDCKLLAIAYAFSVD